MYSVIAEMNMQGFLLHYPKCVLNKYYCDKMLQLDFDVVKTYLIAVAMSNTFKTYLIRFKNIGGRRLCEVGSLIFGTYMYSALFLLIYPWAAMRLCYGNED